MASAPRLRRSFEITVPSDYDWDTYAPWVVRLSEQTIWRRENGIPEGGYLPLTHVVLVHADGNWGYLTAAHATGSDAPRSVAELQERKDERERRAAAQAQKQAEAFKQKQQSAVPVTLATLDRDAPPTLRGAVEAVEQSGGRVDVRGGRVVVSLPPGEVGAGAFGSERSGAKAARVCYLTEAELVAATAGSQRTRSLTRPSSRPGVWRREHRRRPDPATGGATGGTEAA
jgi:hypothetical protein